MTRSSSTLRPKGSSQQGMALVIVMILVLGLAVIAGVFAHAIKVEAKLTANTRSESDLEWLGRSGVEVARWILAEQKRLPGQNQYDALNQFWAGGPGVTNLMDNPFEGWSLDRIELGPGWCAIKIIDQERKININSMADPRNPSNMPLMERALSFVGADGTESPKIVGAIRDWVDRDSNLSNVGSSHGMDSEDYSDMKPPYMPKNGPMDDITELLKVRGVAPEMFWGVGKVPGDANAGDGHGRGLVDLFCALSSNTVNVNTASAEVLSVVYGVDVNVIQETLISKRAGPDGMDGTEDDAPFPNVAAASAIVGAPPGGGGAGGLPGGAVPGAPGGTPPPGAPGPMRLGTQSTVFEVRVEAHMGGSFRRFVAMVDRRNARDPRILYFRRD